MWWITAEVCALDEPIVFHVTQTLHERAAADREKTIQQFHRTLWPTQQLPHDQHRPLITEHLKCSSDWAAIEFATFHRELRSQIDVVCFDLRVECGGVHAQQTRRTRLMATRLFERTPDQIDFKATDFFVKVYAASDIADGRVARAVLMSGRDCLRIADLSA